MLTRPNRVLVTNVTATNTGTSLASIIAGDILVLDSGSNNLTGTPTITSAASNHTIYIAQGTSPGQAELSSPIQLKGIRSARRSGYVAPVEQVLAIGFNGTSGNLITPTNQTEYTLRIVYKDNIRWQPERQTRGIYSFITSSATYRTEVLSAFQAKVNSDKGSKVSAVILTDGTATALGASATLSVTNGSKYVTASASGHALSVGDIVKIGGNTATTGAYVVTAVNGVNITLNSSYQGATNATASGYEMSAITNYGLQLTGEAITFNNIDDYMKISFDASLNGQGLAAESVSYVTAMTLGNGYWQQIRDMEYYAQGYKGVTNRTWFSVPNYPFYYSTTSTYNLFVIEHYHEMEGEMQSNRTNPLTTVIAFHSASAPTASAKETAVLAILESLIESAGVFVQ